MKTVRIAGTQGFYGDSPLGAMHIIEEKAADYLVHDALAELTLSILQKDKIRDPNSGYPRDIEFHAKTIYPMAFAEGIKIVTDSGGLNPQGAAAKVAAILAGMGINGIKIATITGDNLMDELPGVYLRNNGLPHLETGEPFALERRQVTHASVYIGAKAVKEALDQGAQLILAGRVADPCLTLGILAHEFGWDIEDDSQENLDKLASAIATGHLLECGGQASGGNSYAEWPMDYSLSNLAYPIAHIEPDGSAIFTRLESQGGKMSRNTLREQLVYEIHDPANYLTPDVTVDLTAVSLVEEGPDRVRLSGVKGKPRPEKLKLAMGYSDGYLSEQFFFFSWPYAYEKSQKFIKAVKEIWANSPIKIQQMEFDLIGVNGIHKEAAPMPSSEWLNQMNEIGIRVAIRHKDEITGRMAFAAITCLGLNGPPGVASIPGWGKQNRLLLKLWPSLVDRTEIQTEVKIIES